MAKKDVQDDVLGNKFSLVNAKSSKLLSSWLGPEPTPTPATTTSNQSPEDADLIQPSFGHDRLGVGSPIPKDIADGSFTQRPRTTNDKLLEQLIGKKRAKAHLNAKQEAERASARQLPTWQLKKEEERKKAEEESDDEEGREELLGGGRGKVKGKRGKIEVGVEVQGRGEGKDGEVEGGGEVVDGVQEKEEESDDEIDLKPKKRVKKSRAKPTSYLDELLAERSKKKKGKGRGDEEA